MNLREKIIRASYKAGACHIGSALSCADIVEAIYEVKGKDDMFLFAKATGVAALYCYLHPVEKAWKYLKKYPLPSKEVPGLIWTGGSCGQGLSVAVGMALSKKLRKEKGIVYCLISDGEMQEGQTMEAFMFARHHKLENLRIIVDWNEIQSLGRVNDICDYWTLEADILGFDGHDKNEMKKQIKDNQEPRFLFARTVKGKGVDFLENTLKSHYYNLDEKGYQSALLQVADKKGK